MNEFLYELLAYMVIIAGIFMLWLFYRITKELGIQKAFIYLGWMLIIIGFTISSFVVLHYGGLLDFMKK